MVIANSAEQPLAGVVQQRSDGINSGAYAAFDPERATHAISLPWLMDRHEGYSTEISVQHVGGPDTIIRCIFGYADRELTASLSAGQSLTDVQRMLFIEGHTGPAFCMADELDARIAAVVQQRSEDGRHLLIYEGFSVD